MTIKSTSCQQTKLPPQEENRVSASAQEEKSEGSLCPLFILYHHLLFQIFQFISLILTWVLLQNPSFFFFFFPFLYNFSGFEAIVFIALFPLYQQLNISILSLSFFLLFNTNPIQIFIFGLFLSFFFCNFQTY